MQQPVHTVIGAGQVGTKLATLLAARGHQVRLVSRSGTAAGPGVTPVAADITDPTAAATACAGSTAIYNCTNVAYHRWDELLEPVTRGVLDAAARTGARLVVLDNLYMYGRPPAHRPFDEDTPIAPCSRKGELRARLAGMMQDAHARGDVRLATGRASDFFGPGSPRASIFHPRFFARLTRGKSVEVLGDPDQPHAYSYTPDVAAGLATLGERDEALGAVWHLPVAWKGTTRELIARFAAAAGTTVTLRTLPRWLIRLIGVFAPQIGGVAEMLYQWQTPFALDDTRFRRTFALEPTPIDAAITATLSAHALADLRAPAASSETGAPAPVSVDSVRQAGHVG